MLHIYISLIFFLNLFFQIIFFFKFIFFRIFFIFFTIYIFYNLFFNSYFFKIYFLQFIFFTIYFFQILKNYKNCVYKYFIIFSRFAKINSSFILQNIKIFCQIFCSIVIERRFMTVLFYKNASIFLIILYFLNF